MSLCLHHLLRLRLSSGLHSCAPRHRISPGHWHRPRPQTRHVSDDFRYSSSVNLDDAYAGDDLETSADSQDDAVRVESSPTQAASSDILTATEQNNTGETYLNGYFEPTDANQALYRLIQHPIRGRNKGPFAPKPVKSKIIPRRELPIVPGGSNCLDLIIKTQRLYTWEPGYRHWRRTFDLLYTATHYRRKAKKEDSIVLFTLHPGAHYLLDMVQTDPFGLFRQTWEKLDRSVKAVQWRSLALWLLEYSPFSAPEFLYVTVHNNQKPDYHMFVDCFRYLGNLHHELLKQWRRDSLTYSYVVQLCLDPKSWGIRAPDRGFRLHALHSDHRGLCSALDTERERVGDTAFPGHILYLVKRFIDDYGDADRALEGLRHLIALRQPGFEVTSLGFMRHACKLLALDTVKDGPNGRNFYILPQLLAMGVQPNTDMMNIVLRNAFMTGDPQLGLDVLGFMRRQDYGLDSYTYNTLLTDAVANRDRERVVTMIREIERRPEVSGNPYVTSKVMHAHYVFTARKRDPETDPSPIFYDMLDTYNRLHDITPLKELLILPVEYTTVAGRANSPPSMVALYIMIATYLCCSPRYSNVERLYSTFRSLVLQGHPTIAMLAATEHTYIEFLVALRGNPHGLRLAVKIVDDMMHSPSTINLRDGTAIDHVTPGIRTWTVLLSAFIYNKQPYAAEKVKEMMLKHGIQFNHVTWNTIVSGYANAQQIDETAKAIQIMEASGFEVDQYTVKSLRFLHDPEKLWDAMDEFDLVNRKPAPAPTPEVVTDSTSPPPPPQPSETPPESPSSGPSPYGSSSSRSQPPTPSPRVLGDEDDDILAQGLRRLIEKKRVQSKQSNPPF